MVCHVDPAAPTAGGPRTNSQGAWRRPTRAGFVQRNSRTGGEIRRAVTGLPGQEPLQIVRHGGRRRVPFFRLLGQSLQTNRLQVLGHFLVHAAQRTRFVVQDLVHQQPLTALERAVPHEHLVQDHAERVDIAAAIGRVAIADLLGAIYAGVPSTCPVAAIVTSAPSRLANPKSVTCGSLPRRPVCCPVSGHDARSLCREHVPAPGQCWITSCADRRMSGW